MALKRILDAVIKTLPTFNTAVQTVLTTPPKDAVRSDRSRDPGAHLGSLDHTTENTKWTPSSFTGHQPQPPLALPPMHPGNPTPTIISAAHRIILGGADALNDPRNVEYLQFAAHHESDPSVRKPESFNQASFAEKIRDGDSRYLSHLGVAPRFYDYMPQGLESIMKGWTGKVSYGDTSYPYNFDYKELNDALSSDQLEREPASMEQSEQYLCRAALSAQLATTLTMFENTPRSDGDSVLRYRTLGYMNPLDPRAAAQVEQLSKGVPVDASVLTGFSEHPSMASTERGVGGMVLRFPSGLRPAPMSTSNVFEGERESMSACVRLEPRKTQAANVFEVDVKLDLPAVHRCLKHCVKFGVLTDHQAEELSEKIGREPAALA